MISGDRPARELHERPRKRAGSLGRTARLPPGKIPTRILNSTVLSLTGYPSKALAFPPGPGLDFAAVRAGGGYLIVSADPVTGVVENIGRHAVQVSANDVATSGSRPQFAESVILLPGRSSESDLRAIARQVDSTARKLRMTVVGGHTEVTPGLKAPIVMVTAFSFVKEYVSSAGAREGDSIMMTKTAGIEGTAAIAYQAGATLRVSGRTLARAKRMVEQMSTVEDAVAAYESGAARAMHDCTEGGVLGAVFEMSLASGTGFRVMEDSIPVAPETLELCSAASLDPLRLIGSGSLLVAVKKGEEGRLSRALAGTASVALIGEFTKGRRALIGRDGKERTLEEAPGDELWRRFGRLR